jgi:thiosulfate dehydrogenase (quinone) large subunit
MVKRQTQSLRRNIMNALKNDKITGIIWLFARLWLGYEWIQGGIEKVFGEGSAVWVGPKAGVAVTGFLKGAIAKSYLAEGFDPVKTPHPAVQNWYADLVQNVFLPNATLFSYMVAFGELLIGIALIVGLFTRFAAFWGAFLNLAFLFAGTSSTNPQMLVVGLVILLVGGVAVSYYGLDYFARPVEERIVKGVRDRITHAPQGV